MPTVGAATTAAHSPTSYLDGDILVDRIAVWSERLAPPTANQSTTVVEIDGELAGFVHTIFDEDPKWGALVDNLHVTYSPASAKGSVRC